jgi:hypothetical protein
VLALLPVPFVARHDAGARLSPSPPLTPPSTLNCSAVMTASLPTRKIGAHDVSAIGYGAMGIAAFYGAVESDEERFKVRAPSISLDNLCTEDYVGSGRGLRSRMQVLGHERRVQRLGGPAWEVVGLALLLHVPMLRIISFVGSSALGSATTSSWRASLVSLATRRGPRTARRRT